jgi:hypothetical protein
MPVDPTALISAILDGLSKVPPGLFAAIILGGPTAIWLIVRFGHPEDGRKQDPSAMEEFLWVCVWCRSINEDMRDSCYSCRRSRSGQDVPGVSAPGLAPSSAPRTWIAPGVGVAVGPGRPAEAQGSGSWLGAERSGAARPDEEAPEPERVPVPAAASRRRSAAASGPRPVAPSRRPASAAALAYAPDEEDDVTTIDSNVVEPVIVEAKVKVSGRRPASPGR